jgi:hypothetical protein
MSKIAFVDFLVKKGRWDLEWDYIGEGDVEEYDSSNPNDTPRLRATLLYDGEPVEDGSYCTLATPSTPKDELVAAAEALLATVGDSPVDFSRNSMERWTWTKYSK